MDIINSIARGGSPCMLSI